MEKGSGAAMISSIEKSGIASSQDSVVVTCANHGPPLTRQNGENRDAALRAAERLSCFTDCEAGVQFGTLGLSANACQSRPVTRSGHGEHTVIGYTTNPAYVVVHDLCFFNMGRMLPDLPKTVSTRYVPVVGPSDESAVNPGMFISHLKYNNTE